MRLPFEIHIRYTQSEEMEKLCQKSQALMAELVDMRAQRDRAEYRYRCECLINMQLQDLLNEHGIDYRPALRQRPWEEGGSRAPPAEP